MKQIIEKYIEKENTFKDERTMLDKKINKRKQEVDKIEEVIEGLYQQRSDLKYPSWVDSIVKPIAERFSKETGLDYDIYGPFGLRAQVTIYWMKDKKVSITDQSTKSLSLVPLSLEIGQLGYETGKKIEGVRYSPTSIGGLNGMDQEVLPLPNSFEEIKKLIKTKDL